MSDEYAPSNLENCCPDGLIRRTSDVTRYFLNGVESSHPIRKVVKYECTICGRELRLLPVSETIEGKVQP